MRGGHGGCEGVSADDLVEVLGRDEGGGDEGVEALDDELGALEAEHGGNGYVEEGGLGGDMAGGEEEGEEGWSHVCDCERWCWK